MHTALNHSRFSYLNKGIFTVLISLQRINQAGKAGCRHNEIGTVLVYQCKS